MGSAVHSVPAVMASLTAVREQPSASSSSDVSNVVHSITASSLLPQIPGRPGLDATIRANALDHLVPQKIKDKIWAREYVELSNLLQDEDQEMELKITSHSSNPTFTLVPKNKKEVNTIGKWIKAFNCFTAVYARRWPDEVPGLLKHMEVVIGLADDNAGWRMYDRSFRKLHANGLESFGQINVDLYLAAVKGHFRSPNSRWVDEKDGKSGRGEVRGRLASHPPGYCFNFHNGRRCSGCSYKHRCYKCNEDHRVSDCSKPKSATGGKGGNRKGTQHPRKI